ncbi:hypothetical protein [Mycobacterium avium]|uniref:hypothetical protein n=1 Tax=Mycobacterium avium TaxID=1764 RepID=UPI0021E14986|nr:hypothetical protein [Mycobacterium avium]
MQTSVPGVHAKGDVTEPPAFTHSSYDDYRTCTPTSSGTKRGARPTAQPAAPRPFCS